MRMPISVKVTESPVTIARGRSLLPTEPERTAGRMGSTQGVIIVAMPAIKTRNTDGAVGIMELFCFCVYNTVFFIDAGEISCHFDHKDVPFHLRVVLIERGGYGFAVNYVICSDKFNLTIHRSEA